MSDAVAGRPRPALLSPERVAEVLRGAARLAELRRTGLMDAPSEAALDRLSSAATRMLRVPVALVTLVGEDRQFFKGCVGLPDPWITGRETPLSHSFCQHVVATGEPLVITDAREHPQLRASPAIADLRVVAYLGVPLAAPGGEVLGSFCVIDTAPRDWAPHEVSGVQDFARWAAAEVELRLERADLLRAQAANEALSATLHASARELERTVEARTAELREAVARLRASEEDARRLFEGMSDGVLVVDAAGGTVLGANQAACALLGTPREALVGAPAPVAESVSATPRTPHAPGGLRAVHVRPDGERVHLDVRVSTVRRAGRDALLCSCRDVTGQLRAETALRASEERFRSVVERMGEGLLITDPESRIVYANPRVEEIFGWRPDELLGRVSWEVLVHPDDRPAMARRTARRLQGERERYEVRAVHRDGSPRWIEVSAAPFRNADGEVVGTLGAINDVTERRRIREELEHSLSLLRATLDATTDGILAVDLEGHVTSFNGRFLEMWRLGAPRDGASVRRLLVDVVRQLPDPESFLDTVRRVNADPEAELRDEVHFGDGRVFERVSRPQRLGGRVMGRVWSFRDVTDRHRAARALAGQQAYLRAVIDNIPGLVFAKDGDGRFVLANRAVAEHFGVTTDAVLGHTDAELSADVEEAGQFTENDREVIRTRRDLVVDEAVTRPGTGEVRWLQTRKVPLIPPDGGGPQVLGIAMDITDRRRAEAALRESEALFRAIFDASAIGTALLDTEGRLLRTNAAFARMLGRGAASLGHTPLASLVHPADLPAHRDMFRGLVAGEIGHYQLENRLVRADGGVIRGRFTASLVAGAGDRAPFVVGMLEDVTQRHAAEEALAESQRQLLHSQKMEAVGRLAGGIAHDFNNMLMAIGGHAELLATEPGMPASCRWQADEIRKASVRAAGLTRQLLAFSRKQVLQPRPLSLNAVVTEMEDMLRRLLGETVELRAELAPGLGVVRADPGQLGQVLMNLGVNARDAMPDGGTLTLRTANVLLDAEYAAGHDEVRPGPYVVLSVTDTGTGMDAAVRQRIFEPFFTTKPQGQGTGLGLSTVYGIVSQSGGHMRVESAPGEGSTFFLYLPREDAPAATSQAASPPPVRGGRETLLLVEDDEVVRELLRMFLQRLGYRVLGAGGGAEALRVAESAGVAPDLLLTDVVMPGMSGRELTRQVRERWPSVSVIYMSGYTDDAIEQHGVLDPGSEFVQKPVSPDQLAHRVRSVLDARG